MKSDLQAEERLISIVLTHPENTDIPISSIRCNMFSDIQHNMVWDAILRCIEERNTRPTVANVLAMAHLANVSDMITVNVLASYTLIETPPLLWADYAERIVKAYKLRATLDVLYAAAEQLERTTTEEDYDQTLESLSHEVYKVQTQSQESEIDQRETISQQVLEQIFEPSKGVIPTPFADLNALVSGLSDEEMVILAARPGMGKTAFAVSAMVETAKRGVPTALFSLDMGRHQIWRRNLSYLSGISVQRFKEHGTGVKPFDLLERRCIEDARSQFLKLPLYLDASSVYTVNAIRNRIRYLVTHRNARIIFLDHIGKVSADRRFGRTEEVGIIARELKRTAKEYGVSLVVLSQLNRNVEARSGEFEHKRPRMSDLRDSGDIEQEADMVWMLYRPEYYKLTQWEDKSPCQGQIDVMVEKNRDGEPGTARLRFEGYRGAVASFTTL